jgi:choline kinase
MKAIILAAGEGTRLRPYTLDRPKCLLEIDGITLLESQLAVLRSRGVDEIVLVGGYRAEMLEGKATRLRINPRYAETNMVTTLFCAEEELNGEVIVSYGDIVYAGEILDSLLASPAEISVTIDMQWESYWRARNEDPLADAETLRLGEGGRIVEIGQRPTSLDEIEGQYMGLMKFTGQGLERLKEAYRKAVQKGALGPRPVKGAYMTDLLQVLIDNDYRVQAVPVSAPWVEVDSVTDYLSSITKSRILSIDTGKSTLNYSDSVTILTHN